ncbi:hypothetical protein BHE74_00024788, partial [Ensete ventricosum]
SEVLILFGSLVVSPFLLADCFPAIATICFLAVAVAPIDPGTVDAQVAMRSNFDVDSIITIRRLVKVRKNYFIPLEYELHAPLPGEHPYDAFPNGFNLSTDALEVGLRFPLHPSGRRAFQQQRDSRATSGKGKEPGAMEEAPERGNTLWELCEVEDHMGAERYFTIVMTRLKVAEGEDPLMLRWSTIAGSSQFWTEGPLSEEYLRGALHPTLANLDRARDDRAQLEGDVLSLTEAATLLEAKLKDEGAKAVVGYKASRGFESGLKKMGWVSYEFEYRVALKRLRGKHP